MKKQKKQTIFWIVIGVIFFGLLLISPFMAGVLTGIALQICLLGLIIYGILYGISKLIKWMFKKKK